MTNITINPFRSSLPRNRRERLMDGIHAHKPLIFLKALLCFLVAVSLSPFYSLRAYGEASSPGPLAAAVADFSDQPRTAASTAELTLTFPTVGSAPISLTSQSAAGARYFFIPAGLSLSAVVLDFPGSGSGVLGILNRQSDSWDSITPGQSIDLNLYLNEISSSERSLTLGISEGGSFTPSAEYRVMQSANIASVFLTSADPANQGRPYIDGSPDHSTKAPGSIRVLTSDAHERYAGDFSAIKGRGNTSWGASQKKSYQVKLDSKADLMDPSSHGGASEPAKKWLLIANAFDPTLMRNEMTYQLAKDMGLADAVDIESVDLYYDGEYRGNYLLTEKVEIGPYRVDIHDLEKDIEDANPGVDLDGLPVASGTTPYGMPMQYVSGVNAPSDSTGGYLLELDTAYYRAEKSWFKTSSGHVFVSKSPEYLSADQVNHVASLMDEAFTCMMNGGLNPTTGKQLFDYFDQDSFVKYFLIQEFSKSADNFFSSTYFYIPQGQTKIYTGPLWDCDGTYGIRCDYADFQHSSSWLVRNGLRNLLSCTPFCQALSAAYTSAEPLLQNLVYGTADSPGSIAYYSKKNEPSRLMNTKLWGVAVSVPLMTQYPSYESSLQALEQWARARLTWVGGELSKYANGCVMHRIYNPNSGEHFYTADLSEKIKLVSVGWIYEGTGWVAPSSSNAPVYRLYSGTDHHYTTSTSERDYLLALGWTDEGVGWYSDDAQGQALYRQFNPNVVPWASRNNSGSHNYTVDVSERDYLVSLGWFDEGIGWYGLK